MRVYKPVNQQTEEQVRRQRERQLATYYRNREKNLAKAKEYRERIKNDPERREQKKKYFREYAQKNRAHRNQLTQKWIEKNIDKYRKQQREWKRKNRAQISFQTRMKVYGLTAEQLSNLLSIGKCQICGATEKTNSKGKGLVIDHDHISGMVRGLLCHKCNKALGALDDSVEGLQKAMDYLSKSTNV